MKKSFDDKILQGTAGGMEYIYWLTLLGKSRTTGWYWRRPGPNGEPPRVKCCLIDGTLFISQREIDKFWQRAEAGEFAGEFAGVCARKEVA